MKRFLYLGLLALSLLVTSPAYAAIAFVAGTCTQGNTTAAINTTGASLLIVGTTATSSSITISDSKSNTWTKDTGPLTINDSTFIYSAPGTSVGSGHTVTIGTGANDHNTICMAAFSGITSPVFDLTAAQIQPGVASLNSLGTGTTTAADEIIIGYAQLSNNSQFVWTATNGATLAGSLGNGNSDSTGALSYRIVNTSGSYAATFTTTATGTAGTTVATYKAAGPPDTTPPSDPTQLTISAISSESVHLVWNPSTDDVILSGYRIERGSPACSGFAQIGPASTITSPQYDDIGLSNSTSYCYRVRAVDASNNFSGYVTGSVITTKAPQTLFVRFVDSQADGADQETGFNIYRRAGLAGSFTLFTTTSPSNGSGATVVYQDVTAPNPTACYQASAVNTFGESNLIGDVTGVCYTLAVTETTHGNRVRGWRR